MTRSANSMADIVAGLSVAGLLLPEGLAYARLAGLSPAHGLLAPLAGIIAYGAIGRSRFAVVAATSASALSTASALASLVHSGDSGIALLLVGSIGALFILFGLLRLGFLAAFVSRAVLKGFAFGLALSIIIRQLPTLMGLPGSQGSLARQIDSILGDLGQANLLACGIGIGALSLIFVLRKQSRIPGAAAALILGIAASLLLDLGGRGVKLVGPIDIALAVPTIHVPGRAELILILGAALPITLIIFAEGWGAMRALALRDGDALNSNRELVALGCANIVSAAAGGQAVGAGFSASATNQSSGAHSRGAAYVAAAGLAVLLLLGRPLVAQLPEPVLAAVIIAALRHALDPRPLVRLHRLGRDFWLSVAAAAGVLAFGVLYGLLAAVALSVLALIGRFARPRLVELGRLGEGRDFVELARHPEARRVPGALIVRAGEPLFFANVESILMRLEAQADAAHVSLAILSLEESDDLDSSAIEALGESATRLKRRDCRLQLARVKDPIRDLLARGGAAAADLGAHSTRSVAAAADFHLKEST